MANIELSFSSIADLRRWLEKKAYEAGDPDAFYSWLNVFFDSGNSITVHGENYDYWSCWELF